MAARDTGSAEIYTATDSAANIMERRGWRRAGDAESLRGAVAVYRRALAPDST